MFEGPSTIKYWTTCLTKTIKHFVKVKRRTPLAVWPWFGHRRRQCNTLCTSGFVDDVTFSHNGLRINGPNTDKGLEYATTRIVHRDSSGGAFRTRGRSLLSPIVLFVESSSWLPALKPFSGENDEIEEISDDSEEADRRYSVPVDYVTYDVVMYFRITSIRSVPFSGFRYLRSRYSTAQVTIEVLNRLSK